MVIKFNTVETLKETWESVGDYLPALKMTDSLLKGNNKMTKEQADVLMFNAVAIAQDKGLEARIDADGLFVKETDYPAFQEIVMEIVNAPLN